MKKINYILIFLSLIIASCNKVSERKITVDNCFELIVPSEYESTSGLNQSALLELNDKKDSCFLIVLQEKKSEILSSGLTFNLDTYTKFASRNATSNYLDVRINETKNISVGSYKATATEVTGLLEDNNIFYYVVVIETKDSFFQIISWMQDNNKEDKLVEVKKTINSFKAL